MSPRLQISPNTPDVALSNAKLIDDSVDKPNSIDYTVQAGDNHWKIADKLGVEPVKLAQLNPAFVGDYPSNMRVLRKDEVITLTLPVGHSTSHWTTKFVQTKAAPTAETPNTKRVEPHAATNVVTLSKQPFQEGAHPSSTIKEIVVGKVENLVEKSKSLAHEAAVLARNEGFSTQMKFAERALSELPSGLLKHALESDAPSKYNVKVAMLPGLTNTMEFDSAKRAKDIKWVSGQSIPGTSSVPQYPFEDYHPPAKVPVEEKGRHIKGKVSLIAPAPIVELDVSTSRTRYSGSDGVRALTISGSMGAIASVNTSIADVKVARLANFNDYTEKNQYTYSMLASTGRIKDIAMNPAEMPNIVTREHVKTGDVLSIDAGFTKVTEVEARLVRVPLTPTTYVVAPPNKQSVPQYPLEDYHPPTKVKVEGKERGVNAGGFYKHDNSHNQGNRVVLRVANNPETGQPTRMILLAGTNDSEVTRNSLGVIGAVSGKSAMAFAKMGQQGVDTTDMNRFGFIEVETATKEGRAVYDAVLKTRSVSNLPDSPAIKARGTLSFDAKNDQTLAAMMVYLEAGLSDTVTRENMRDPRDLYVPKESALQPSGKFTLGGWMTVSDSHEVDSTSSAHRRITFDQKEKDSVFMRSSANAKGDAGAIDAAAGFTLGRTDPATKHEDQDVKTVWNQQCTDAQQLDSDEKRLTARLECAAVHVDTRQLLQFLDNDAAMTQYAPSLSVERDGRKVTVSEGIHALEAGAQASVQIRVQDPDQFRDWISQGLGAKNDHYLVNDAPSKPTGNALIDWYHRTSDALDRLEKFVDASEREYEQRADDLSRRTLPASNGFQAERIRNASTEGEFRELFTRLEPVTLLNMLPELQTVEGAPKTPMPAHVVISIGSTPEELAAK